MQSVAKWGNSLAVRIPADLVRQLGLKAGDKVELKTGGNDSVIEVTPALTREQAIADLKAMRKWRLPVDYKFDREEANSRGAD